jgi:hypothetical protein
MLSIWNLIFNAIIAISNIMFKNEKDDIERRLDGFVDRTKNKFIGACVIVVGIMFTAGIIFYFIIRTTKDEEIKKLANQSTTTLSSQTSFIPNPITPINNIGFDKKANQLSLVSLVHEGDENKISGQEIKIISQSATNIIRSWSGNTGIIRRWNVKDFLIRTYTDVHSHHSTWNFGVILSDGDIIYDWKEN